MEEARLALLKERLDKIRQSLADGTLDVDATKLAEALLNKEPTIWGGSTD